MGLPDAWLLFPDGDLVGSPADSGEDLCRPVELDPHDVVRCLYVAEIVVQRASVFEDGCELPDVALLRWKVFRVHATHGCCPCPDA